MPGKGKHPLDNRDPVHTPPCSLLLSWHYYFAPAPYWSSCLASGFPFSWRIPTWVSFRRQVPTGVSSRRQVLTGISFRRRVPSWCTTCLLNCSDLSWVPSSPSRVPSSPSRVPFHLHGSNLLFHSHLPSSLVSSSPSRVPFQFHWSPSIFTGPLLSFTGPLLSSDESILVSKPSTKLLRNVTISNVLWLPPHALLWHGRMYYDMGAFTIFYYFYFLVSELNLDCQHWLVVCFES